MTQSFGKALDCVDKFSQFEKIEILILIIEGYEILSKKFGFVHGDIKKSNILYIRADKKKKIRDFEFESKFEIKFCDLEKSKWNSTENEIANDIEKLSRFLLSFIDEPNIKNDLKNLINQNNELYYFDSLFQILFSKYHLLSREYD